MNVLFRIVLLKIQKITFKLHKSWIVVRKVATTRHVCFFHIVDKSNGIIYKECRCGARQVEFSSRGFSPIHTDWLMGEEEIP
jgi:hypothetical protein